MQSKRNLLLFFFILSAVVVIFPFCHNYQYDSASYHGFLKTAGFKNMKPADRVAKCASCHKREYENEMNGPHANAYKMLLQHRDFVNSDLYKCSFWTKHVNTRFEDCMACHTPQNLFQTLLYDSLKDMDGMVKQVLSAKSLPLQRMDENSRVTSIDCFSCHFDGDNLRSLKHVKTASDANPDYQTVPVIAKNNLVCYPCHNDEINTINARMVINKTGSVQCTSCHMEYDTGGKATHYIYWRHEARDKVNTTLLHLMDDFHFRLSPDKSGGEITWLNTTIPHKMSPIIEIILKCEVLDKDSNTLATKLIRINRKKEFDDMMYEHLWRNYLYGVQGDSAMLNGEAVKYDFPVKNATEAELFKISLLQKAQYWFPDSLGVLTATKIYPVKQNRTVAVK